MQVSALVVGAQPLQHKLKLLSTIVVRASRVRWWRVLLCCRALCLSLIQALQTQPCRLVDEWYRKLMRSDETDDAALVEMLVCVPGLPGLVALKSLTDGVFAVFDVTSRHMWEQTKVCACPPPCCVVKDSPADSGLSGAGEESVHSRALACHCDCGYQVLDS